MIMGSKKHKKHKSERRERFDDHSFSLDRPPSLKLILKVGGSNSTPEHGNDSPAYGIHSENNGLYNEDYHERHKKSKKKKKKKDREKKHKHHHKEKRRHRDDSSQEDMSLGDDSSQLNENILRYSSLTTANSIASTPVTKPLIPIKSPETMFTPSEMITPAVQIQQHIQPAQIDNFGNQKSAEKSILTPSSGDTSHREPRTCVLKLKQSRSPLAKLLDHLLKLLEKRDPHQFFAWPVTDDIAPGYSSIISKPMDFSSMRQKIDDNLYTTLQEFSDDFKLMCENAIKYNHIETVYHKAAKRLLHVGARLLQPENLIRSLRPLLVYMRELSPKELGFEIGFTDNHEAEMQNLDSADEGMMMGTDEPTQAQLEEEEKRKIIKLENNPKSRFEPYVDDLTNDEILAQVQTASRNAKNRLINRNHQVNRMGFLRENRDGTTSMKILLDTENDGPERLISLGAFTGKLQQGTGQLQGFREDRRNVAKAVKTLNYGAFCSFAPIYDSRFSNLSKEETELVLNTYGDETGAQYAESIIEFTKESLYASTIANGLLDILTSGEHRKTMATLIESQRQRYDQEEVEKSFPDPKQIDDHDNDDEIIKKYENVKIDFNNLRTLSELGVDVKFLDNLEETMEIYEMQKKLQNQLESNSSLIERLQQVQHDRLSQPLPAHLSHVARPNTDEIQLATQITSNISEIAKQMPPNAITTPHALRKAMGLSNVGLETFPRHESEHQNQPLNAPPPDIDTTSVPMELEPDSLVHHHVNTTNVENNTSVDLENELREFLEGSSSGLAGVTGADVEHDTSSIEQMLLS